MASVEKFSIHKLNELIDTHGVKKAWLSVVATLLNTDSRFDYVLASPEFSDVIILEENIIQGLSIGEIGALYEYSVAYVDVESRKDNGQFFTPDDVSIFIANFSQEFEPGIWLDPCSGVGNLSWHLVNQQDDSENFLLHQMICSDLDALALLIARSFLTYSFQDKETRLFNKIEKNFVHFDFLSVSDKSDNSLFSGVDDSPLTAIPQHDYVIVNPPYLAVKQDSRFQVNKSGDLYAYFLENIIKTSRGFISITPQSFTNAGKFRELRKMLLSYSSLKVFCFDNVPGNVFKGVKFGSKNTNKVNSIRAAVTVAKMDSEGHQITSLLRWRSKEREKMLESAHETLSSTELTEDFFPKVGKSLANLYRESREWGTLKDLVATSETEFPLYVPSTPRYFIPGLKTEVKRSSQITLFFPSEVEREKAYLVINSSLMYWWWRVRDGGMTLSRETLLSTPIPEFAVSDEIVKALEASEVDSKVYKVNAGVTQENVKHSESLVVRVTESVVPGYAKQLKSTHNNSDFSE